MALNNRPLDWSLLVEPSLRRYCNWMRARNPAAMYPVSPRLRLVLTTGSMSLPPHHLDLFLLHQVIRLSIKASSLDRAALAWVPRLQHPCLRLRPSHLSASLHLRFPQLAIVAINSHRYPSRRTIRIFLSILSTAITTAISFLTQLNNSNSPYMSCRLCRKTVLRGGNGIRL